MLLGGHLAALPADSDAAHAADSFAAANPPKRQRTGAGACEPLVAWAHALLPRADGETSWRRLLLLSASLRLLCGRVPGSIHLSDVIRSLLPLAAGCAEESEREVQLFALLGLYSLAEVPRPPDPFRAP